MKGTLFGDLPEEKGAKHSSQQPIVGKGDKSTGDLPAFGATSHLKPAMAPVCIQRNPGSKARAKTRSRRQHVEKARGNELLTTPLQKTGLETTVEDAYDPSKPNDFEEIKRKKQVMRQKREEELDALQHTRIKKKVNNAAQVPMMMMEKTPEKGMTLAQKMLEKMGWKKGEGLGKMKQGISQALEVEKTDARRGRVILPTDQADPPEQMYKPIHTQHPPSKVIILTNVVAPGNVDESLDEEIGEECSKYGEVESVLIFEVTDPLYPPDKAVRIFVQFENLASATAALKELHGRYFAGRVVSADYFDQDRFDAQDIAPRAT